MHIVVLLKAVPVVGTERLDRHVSLTGRSALEANGNDEYVLEKALKLTEAHGGEVIAPDDGSGTRTGDAAQGPRDGRHARRTTCTDDALAGSDIRATVDVLAAALRKLDVRPASSRAPTRPTGRAASSARPWRSGSACRISPTPRRSSPTPTGRR